MTSKNSVEFEPSDSLEIEHFAVGAAAFLEAAFKLGNRDTQVCSEFLVEFTKSVSDDQCRHHLIAALDAYSAKTKAAVDLPDPHKN